MRRATADEHEPHDPSVALMREVGAQLRQVRLERGEDLEQVAEHLRIKPTYLFAIEQGDLSVMPGRTYALGFLRSYADHLGFDGEDLIHQIKSTVDSLTTTARLHVRTPLPESRLPRTPVVVLSLAIVAGVYAGWSYLHRSGELMVEQVAEVPENLRRLAYDALPAAPGPDAPPAAGAAPPTTAPAADPVMPEAVPEETGSALDPQSGSPEVAAPAAERTPRTDTAAAFEEVPAERGGAPDPGGPAETAATPAAPGVEPVDGASADGTATAAGEPAGARAPAGRPTVATATPAPAPEPASAAGDGGGPAASPATGVAAPTPRTDIAGLMPAAGPETATAPGSDEGAASERAPSGDLAVIEARAPAGPGDDVEAPVGAGVAEESRVPASEVLARLDLASAPPAAEAAGGAERVVHEPQNTDARIILHGTGTSWVQITSPSGDYLRSRTLRPGDALLVPDRDDLVLWTGNAGGIEIIVDGRVLPALGSEGAVVRDVPLDPEQLLAR